MMPQEWVDTWKRKWKMKWKLGLFKGLLRTVAYLEGQGHLVRRFIERDKVAGLHGL